MAEPVGILFCTDGLGAGGAERQTVELILRLDPARFRPRVLCLHGSAGDPEPHFASTLRQAGVEVEFADLRWTVLQVPRGLGRIAATVRRHRPAIVHALNHHSNHLARLARGLMPRNLKLITAIRTDYTPRQLLYERIEHRFADGIVTNNPQMVPKLLTHSRVPERKLVYIPNGLDVARFEANPDLGLRERLAPTARHLGVMMGRITLQKSPYLLAEALGRLKSTGRLPTECQCWVVGEPDSPDQQQRLDDAVRRFELGAVLRQFPASAQPEAFYHASDFTVLPSLWEGVPNVVLESFAAGRPALVSEAANASGVVEPGVTGWVVRTNDVEDLARGLRAILHQPPEQLRRLAPACRHAASRFSMPRMVARYEQLYRALLESQPLPGWVAGADPIRGSSGSSG